MHYQIQDDMDYIRYSIQVEVLNKVRILDLIEFSRQFQITSNIRLIFRIYAMMIFQG